MSSQPNPGGVKRLLTLAMKLHKAKCDMEQATIEIDGLQRQLKAAEADHRELKRLIVEQLQKMDCAANHNAGWEDRITWMFGELAKQAAQMELVPDDDPLEGNLRRFRCDPRDLPPLPPTPYRMGGVLDDPSFDDDDAPDDVLDDVLAEEATEDDDYDPLDDESSNAPGVGHI